MIRSLWSHCRNINVEVFQNKVIYDIPLYGDLVFKNFKAEYKHGGLVITTFQEPTPHHLEESSLCTVKSQMVIPDENDKYSESYPLIYREMK